ncbi:nicotianamine aminotransferase 1-like isoform X1 [Henckelia pumila]|uniref:nicotianamine aminotransferase 1-like isoform X1 n=1 Tax=Henckelia pumila TaxID=405737 RepID=UPI003C6DDBC6
MENKFAKWGLKNQKEAKVTIREILEKMKKELKNDDERPMIHLGHGDPSAYSSFRTTPVAEEAVNGALRSAKFNGYAPAAGLPESRRAVAEFLSKDLPYNLSEEDIFITAGAAHAIELILTVLAQPGANILLPRPGYPSYEAHSSFVDLEVRHFDLFPEKDWEIDLDGVEALADVNTVAMVVINPGNPSGSVFTWEHLRKIAETAKRLGIVLISDEVYYDLVFGGNKFVPMGVFGSVTPVVSLGTMSKRWLVPGWRLGWIALSDPNGILEKSGITECIKNYRNISADSTTLIQGAIPEILEKTPKDFISNIVVLLREAADACCSQIMEIPFLYLPQKPQGAMSTMVKLNLDMLEGIEDDMDFCFKLAKEESVLILPGSVLGLKNWLRISFAADLASLEEGLHRIKAFCCRHSNMIM